MATITVHIKMASGQKHTVSVDPEGTVPDLKVSQSQPVLWK